MGKPAELFGKLKKIKHIEIIVAICLTAVVLAIYFGCVSCASVGESKESVAADTGDYCSYMQTKLGQVVSEIDGVGNASIIINWDKSVHASFVGGTSENPSATGVIVVCDGGNDPKVKVDVIFAVSTLLDLSIDKIVVYPKSK